MLFFTLGSVFLLLYAAYHPYTGTVKQIPVECSGKCKNTQPPVQWNIISPTFFHTES